MLRRSGVLYISRLHCCVAFFAALVTAAPRASAQAARDLRAGPAFVSEARQPLPRFGTVADQHSLALVAPLHVAGTTSTKQSHRAAGALIGALAGAALLGGVEAHHAAHCDDCFFQGPAIALAVGVGAVGGGLIGWLFAAAAE